MCTKSVFLSAALWPCRQTESTIKHPGTVEQPETLSQRVNILVHVPVRLLTLIKQCVLLTVRYSVSHE